MASRNWISYKNIGLLSYTEDNILIYLLYVTIPYKIDKNQLKEYFSKFGEVVKVIIKNKQNCSTSFAYVSFTDARSASKALNFKDHSILNGNDLEVLLVSNADSWKQPFQKRLGKIESEYPDCFNLNISILNLNDDCLLAVFEYLSFKEQVQMSDLCKRLDTIFRLLYKSKKSIYIDLKESLTLMDFRQGLQKIGNFIERIKISSGFSRKNFIRFIHFVLKFCPNLFKLQLDSSKFNSLDSLYKVSKNLPKIHHLELKNCLLNDDIVKLLSNISSIEYLDLTDNDDVSGLHLEKFENLKTLILNSCYYLLPSYFIKMCSKTIKIKELNINRCLLLNSLSFKAIVDNLHQIETLTISTNYATSEFYMITQLKALKHLTIDDRTIYNTDILFCKLVENKKNQIETLKITYFSHSPVKVNAIIQLENLKQLDLPLAKFYDADKSIENFSNLKKLKIFNAPGVKMNKDSLLKLISKSPNIEFIDISRRKDYNDEFIKDVIQILLKQSRFHPLTLRIGFTGVSNDIKQKSFVKQNESILKIDTKQTDYEEMFL